MSQIETDLRARLTELQRHLNQEVEAREQRNACDRALSDLRQRVRSMAVGEDLSAVTESVGSCLRDARVPYDGYGVNFVDDDHQDPRWTQVLRTAEGGKSTHVRGLESSPAAACAWRERILVYRPDLQADDPYDEVDTGAHDIGQQACRAIVDVPFSHGTVTVNSTVAAAFGDPHIVLLQRVAEVLSEAMQRWADLAQLAQRNDELAERLGEGLQREAELARVTVSLEERERLLTAFHETGKVLLTALDPDAILDALSLQVIEAGVFRSITIALVDEDAHRVRVVRSYIRHRRADGMWTPVQQTELSSGIDYDLDDENITAQVARTGAMEVIEGWDSRYDERRRDTTSLISVAYFIPVIHQGRTIAVLGTGSLPQEREEVLRQIDILHPFFDQVAIALYHARLYHELQQRERELRQAQKMEVMGELTAGIAHNFNNLLQAVTGNLELAIDDARPAVRERLLETLSLANRQAELVRQLMAYSRKGTEVTRQPIELGEVAESVASICRNTFDRRIEFISEIEAGLPPVLGDSTQLEQVLLNLCMNARDAVIKARSAQPYVQLRIRQQQEGEKQAVCVTVQDNGTGIEPAHRERIFDPFFTTKEVGSGTGLGLSIVHGIMRQHGGRVTCDSEVGRGSTFELFLRAAEVGARPSVTVQHPVPSGGSETILIVEDEESVRTTVGHALSRLGYRVLLATDGEEGMSILEREAGAVDLMLLDVSMPRMSGPELLAQIDPDHSPLVILFTGFATPHELQGQVAAVLEKPLTPRALVSCVRSVLDSRAGGDSDRC
jgi:signal transduction histidine kinase